MWPEWLTQGNCGRVNLSDINIKMIKTETSELQRRARQFFNAYFSNRKLVLGTLVILFVILYFIPNWLGFGSIAPPSEASSSCLEDQLRQWMQQKARYDVSIRHSPLRNGGILFINDFPKGSYREDASFVPFTGNGHIGLTLGDSDQELRVRHRRSLSLSTGIHPVIRTYLKGASSSDAYVTDYIGGSVKRIQCYNIDSECVVITSTIYAHRQYTTVIVQDITVRNPLERSVEVYLKRDPHNWSERSQKTFGEQTVNLIGKALNVPDTKGQQLAISAALPLLPSSPLSVKQKSSESFRYLTLVDTSEPTQPELYSNQKKLLDEGITKLYKIVNALDIGTINSHHKVIWEQLWNTGFGLSYSLAPDVLNGDMINATRYAVLANTPGIIQEYLARE